MYILYCLSIFKFLSYQKTAVNLSYSKTKVIQKVCYFCFLIYFSLLNCFSNTLYINIHGLVFSRDIRWTRHIRILKDNLLNNVLSLYFLIFCNCSICPSVNTTGWATFNTKVKYVSEKNEV